MQKFILWICLLALVGCGRSEVKQQQHMIGRDPSWFPLHLGSHAVNLTAFSTALIQEIARTEDYAMDVVDIDWVQLFENLEKEQIGGVLSSLNPNLLTQNKYSFSEPLVYLGPVLVVKSDSQATSLLDFSGKIVAVFQFDDSVLVAQEYPSVVIQLYQNMPDVLNDLIQGSVDAVLMPVLDARALVYNKHPLELKIATEPLNIKAIRLVTLKDKNKSLIRHFNHGLKKLRDNGTYASLRNQYKLT